MKTKIIFAFALFLLISISPLKIQAQEKASGSSANFSSILNDKAVDNRSEVLQKYLEAQDSPLAQYASDFVEQADKYNIDWRFLAAVSGVESTFGKEVPCTNAFGFGVYGDQTMCFNSYPEAIQTISKTIRERYINDWKENDVESIGRSYAASPAWAGHVNYFMDQIQAFALLPENQPLSITL